MLKVLRQIQYGNRLLNYIDCYIQEFRRVDWHVKCRGRFYPGTNDGLKRRPVSDSEVKWYSNVTDPPYDPPEYTAKVVLDGPDWADPGVDEVWFSKKPRWNINDGQVYNRQCGSHIYAVNESIPLNPVGRTGLRGRGILGRWGPNHAVHLIVARWKLEATSNDTVINKHSLKPEMEVVSVLKDGVKQWALPGRFLSNNKERVESAITRCFVEECLDNLKHYQSMKDRDKILRRLKQFFAEAKLIYRGYVDDPRNTDNAWVSSTVMYMFDLKHKITRSLDLHPGGSNILGVNWINAKKIPIIGYFGNHEDFVNDTARLFGAHYPDPPP